MTIEVSVPGLLSDCTGGRRRFTLAAETLRQALVALVQEYPLLRVHLYDENDCLRPHILVYLNDQNIAWLENHDIVLRPADKLRILQSVSGG